MKKEGFFSFRVNSDDRKNIQDLAQLLGRNKGDAIRFAVMRVLFERLHPEIGLMKIQEDLKNEK